jgi:hypothetical protein
MINKTKEFKTIEKTDTDKLEKQLSADADLPGVVETAGLGKIKKPKSSKKS